jgi:hypothetical protein
MPKKRGIIDVEHLVKYKKSLPGGVDKKKRHQYKSANRRTAVEIRLKAMEKAIERRNKELRKKDQQPTLREVDTFMMGLGVVSSSTLRAAHRGRYLVDHFCSSYARKIITEDLRIFSTDRITWGSIDSFIRHRVDIYVRYNSSQSPESKERALTHLRARAIAAQHDLSWNVSRKIDILTENRKNNTNSQANDVYGELHGALQDGLHVLQLIEIEIDRARERLHK